MADLYTEDDLKAAVKATRRVKGGTIVGLLAELEVRRALDAAAPAIAARAFAAGYIEGVAWDGWVPTDEEAAAAARTWIEAGE